MTKENIERLIDAAQKGNADAAIELGDFLMENPTRESLSQALYWFTEAINNGSSRAYLRAMFLHNIKAKEAKEDFDWDAVQQHANLVLKYYQMVSQSTGNTADFMEKVREEYCDAIYYLATAKFFIDDEAGALSLLTSVDIQDFSTPLVYILMGCIQFSLANNGKELNDACNFLSPLEKLAESAVHSAQDRADQLLLAKGFGLLEIHIRLGDKDLQRAYNVLKNGYELLSDKNCRNLLLDEMAHYQRGFFGGLKYVE